MGHIPGTYSNPKEPSMYVAVKEFGKGIDYQLGNRSRLSRFSTYFIPNSRGDDLSGASGTRKYVSTHAVDGEYYINAKNEPFQAYLYGDDKHPGQKVDRIEYEWEDLPLYADGSMKRCLVKCNIKPIRYLRDDVSATVKITNQLNIKTQIIGN